MDYGQQVVQEVYEKLKIDDEWSIRGERGFTWWAGDLRQEVWAERPFEDHGMTIVRVHARTDLIKGYSGEPTQKEGLLRLFPQSALSGFVPHVDDPSRIQLASSVYVNESTIQWMGELFQWAVILQNAESHSLIQSLGSILNAEADTSEHPNSGRREEFDEMLGVPSQVMAPMGQQRSLFRGKEMLRQLRKMNQAPAIDPFGSPEDLSVDYPFLGRTIGISITTYSDDKQLGNGLRSKVRLPFLGPTSPDEIGDVAEWVLQMNQREVSELTRAHFLGGWSLTPQENLGFTSFYPNAMYRPGLLENLYMSDVMRCRWLAEDVYGDDWANGGFELALRNHRELMKIGARIMSVAQGVDQRKGSFLSRIFRKRNA